MTFNSLYLLERRSLKPAVGDACVPVFYLEIPPFLFWPVIKGLSNVRRRRRWL